MGLPLKYSKFFTLVGGLNTEVTPLNMPENDLLTAQNIFIDKTRGIVRRTGVDFIGTKDSDSEIYTTVDRNTYPITHTYVWRPVFNNARRNYLVHIMGDTLNVYNFDNLSLSNYDDALISSAIFPKAQQAPISFCEWNNFLFMIGADLDSFPINFYRLYLDEDGEIALAGQNMFVRDIENQVVDSLVKNGGTTYSCIITHSSESSNEPGVGTSWESYWEIYAYEEVSGVSAWALSTDYTSNIYWMNNAANQYLRRLYSLSTSDPIPNVDVVELKGGCVAQGRLWIFGPIRDGTIYFSQTLVEKKHIQHFYTFNDPNSTIDSSILDTDGGSIHIADAGRIFGIQPHRTGVFVLSENGIWSVRGTQADEGFLPTAFTVDKIWNQSVYGYRGAITVEDTLIFADDTGIYTLGVITQPDGTSRPQLSKITSKIDTRWENIPSVLKNSCQLHYDKFGKKLYVLHNTAFYDWMQDVGETRYPLYHRANTILIFDWITKGWWEYIIDNDSGSGTVPEISEIFSGFGQVYESAQVITEALDDVIAEDLSDVVANVLSSSLSNEFNVYIVAVKNSGSTDAEVAFGYLQGTAYSDWATTGATDDDSVAYTSTFSTAYLIENDLMQLKEHPYIIFLMERDDTNFGLKAAFDWNWATQTGAENPYDGTLVDIYSGGEFVIPSGSRPTVVEHKRQIPGMGRSLIIRFANNGAKGFRLYGWQMGVATSRRMS